MLLTIDHKFLKFDCPAKRRIGAETVEYYRKRFLFFARSEIESMLSFRSLRLKIKKNMKHIFYIQQPPRQILFFPANSFSF